jgi:ComF family protein
MARSFFAYGGPVRGMVAELKYSGRRRMARTMAMLAWGDDSPARAALSGAEVVVAVPLHSSRQRMRGYNQSEELARELAGLAGKPFVAGALARIRDTRPQVGLKRDERRDNVRNAFAVVQPGRIAGREVALVDDVLTTGATLSECARALAAAGARGVRGICFGRDL